MKILVDKNDLNVAVQEYLRKQGFAVKSDVACDELIKEIFETGSSEVEVRNKDDEDKCKLNNMKAFAQAKGINIKGNIKVKSMEERLTQAGYSYDDVLDWLYKDLNQEENADKEESSDSDIF